ncbi:MAG: hypothetical protein QOK44_372 [Betaproteobacteria bacterium]|nr:hypothetical protein [Betaproteobacteria bacterium]
MECPSCHAETPDVGKFCVACGATLPGRCPSCGRANPSGARFCLECGQKLSTVQAETTTKPVTATISHAPLQPVASAERRQLTVMFCDLVGSTALSARLDPEDMREVIGAYHGCCTEQITKGGGFVAKYMGDGVLAYFGYPQAHEDDAERAVRSALSLLETIPKRSLRQDAVLQVRVGIATGVVVVGDLIGEGAAREQGVVGDTPNLAARLQALAEPQQVVISQSTRRLTGGLFEYHDLGRIALKGLDEPVQTWQVTGASPVESRFEAQHETNLTPLVGRDEELELLMRRWRQAVSGEGRVVLLSGEPGIGKSRLMVALQERLQAVSHTRLRYFCSPQHTDSAFYPVIAQLERAMAFARHDTPDAKFDKLSSLVGLPGIHDEDVLLLAELLSIPAGDRHAPLNWTPRRQKEKTLEALLRQLEVLSRQLPVFVIYEDVHWIDPSARELLDMAVEGVVRLPVLLVITFRPEFQPPWTGQTHVSTLSLSRLGRREGIALVGSVAQSDELPEEIVGEIIERTDGVPLFVEELTKAVVEARARGDEPTRAVLATPLGRLMVPSTLHASLLARLDALRPVAREVAQVGAAVGREFTYELLALVAGKTDAELQQALGQLRDAGLVFWRGTPPQATFLFKHALVRDAAYGTLLRSRRQKLHGLIASAIEERFSEVAQARPELLALHCTEADRIERAIAYWYSAGRQASARFAMQEAATHLTKGIELLATLPKNSARDEQEINCQLALAVPLIAMHGYGSAPLEDCATRARKLSDGLGEHESRFAVYRVVWNSCLLRRPVPQSVDLAQNLMTFARETNDTARLAIAHRALGYSMQVAGAPAQADELLAEGALLADRALDAEFAIYGEHPGMVCRTYRGLTRCLMGFLDDGFRLSEAAIQHARIRNNPVSLAWALISAAAAYAWCRETSAARRLALEAIDLSREHRLPQWRAFAEQSLGYAMCLDGDLRAGIESQKEAFRSLHRTGSVLHTSRFHLQLAESYFRCSELDQANSHLVAGFTHVKTHGEMYAAAELHRVKAVLLHAQGAPDEKIETALKTGLALASSQGARLFELRASTWRARFWRDQGKRTDARDLLAPIHGWFTEGFDTPDLTQAKTLLDELV